MLAANAPTATAVGEAEVCLSISQLRLIIREEVDAALNAQAQALHTLLTTDELASELRVSGDRVLEMVAEGVIPCMKLSKRCFRFRRDAVWAAIEKYEVAL